MAAVVFNYVQYHRFVNLTARDCTLNTGRECRGKGGAEQQWLFVDELDAGLRQSDSGRTGAWKDERCDEHVAGGFSRGRSHGSRGYARDEVETYAEKCDSEQVFHCSKYLSASKTMVYIHAAA